MSLYLSVISRHIRAALHSDRDPAAHHDVAIGRVDGEHAKHKASLVPSTSLHTTVHAL